MPVDLTSNKKRFDIAIIGAGCAGLSLLSRLLDSVRLQHLSIILIDEKPKVANDRTWCFWQDAPGYYDHLVLHRWPQMRVVHTKESLTLKSHYEYCMIRSADFYAYHRKLLKSSRVTVVYGLVSAVNREEGTILIDGQEWMADKIFSSVLLDQPTLLNSEFYLLQHFRGWFISVQHSFFNLKVCDLMNFKTSQQHGCSFVYVLPLTDKTALIEHTLFNENVLQDEEYDAALKTFISQELKLLDYTINEVENGVIPMTNYRFKKKEGRVIYIGTAGGQTKASSGYTFQFIQRHSNALVQALEHNTSLEIYSSSRFNFYDSVLLNVLHHRKTDGANMFYKLFKKNPADRVFKFLDNQSSLLSEIALMNSTDKSVFIPAAIEELRKNRTQK